MSSGTFLSGLRVLDLADESAAFASRILADLGADVIRVEDPDEPGMRTLAPHADANESPETSLLHLYDNAGKRSVIVPDDAGFEKLLASADILIETRRLDHEALLASNPALIHVTVTPYGLEGPWHARVGNDLTLSAAGGLTWLCGAPNDPPNQPGGRQAYRIASLAAATAAMIALHRAERSATHIDISVQRAVAGTTLQSGNITLADWYGNAQRRPAYGSAMRCADGKWTTNMQVPPPKSAAFRQWAEAEGLPMPPLEGTPLPELRRAYGDAVRELAGKYPRDEFLEKGWACGMVGMPILAMADIAAYDHFNQTGAFVPVHHDSIDKDIRFPNSPVVALGVDSIRRAPLLGEHTAEVLAENRPARKTQAAAQASLFAESLADIRVVDFTWVLAGPLGTRILANFGAEVIRVSAGRRAYPDTLPPDHDETVLGAFHNLIDTGKRSVTIDPRTGEGRRLILELIAKADVVTENYRPGALAAMGLGYDVLKEINPKLICVHMPGCGSVGPWSKRGTYGPHISSASGIDALMGFPDSPPFGMGPAYPDFTSPYVMVTCLLAALRRRDETGEGMDIDLSQLAATFSLLGPEWMQYDMTGESPPRSKNRDPNYCPHGVYPSAGEDEWIALAVAPEAFDTFCEAMGNPALASDPRFATPKARKQNEDDLDALVRDWTGSVDRFELADRLQKHGIAAVESVFDVLDGKDPQLASTYYRKINQPVAPDLDITVAGEVIQEAGKGNVVPPAPEPGEANRYVVCDLLGYPEETLDRLRRDGVVREYRYFPERQAQEEEKIGVQRNSV